MADVLVVNKANAAHQSDVAALTARLRAINPRATVVRGNMPVRLDDPAAISGRRVLVIEDGPTLTHGGMASGAGAAAALAAGAAELVDPRTSAPPVLMTVFADTLISAECCRLWATARRNCAPSARQLNTQRLRWSSSATPIDLAALIPITKPLVRARYEFVEDPGGAAVGNRRSLSPRLSRRFLSSMGLGLNQQQRNAACDRNVRRGRRR